jgi:hypothetical protein
MPIILYNKQDQPSPCKCRSEPPKYTIQPPRTPGYVECKERRCPVTCVARTYAKIYIWAVFPISHSTRTILSRKIFPALSPFGIFIYQRYRSLKTLGFQPSLASAAISAFSSATRTSLSNRSLALKILL